MRKLKQYVIGVERGGGLLIAGYYAADTHHGSNINRLMGEFGVTCNEDLVMPAKAEEYDTRRQAFGADESLGIKVTLPQRHPLTSGVKRLVLLSSCSLQVNAFVPVELQLQTDTDAEIWIPEGPKDAKGMRPIIERWVRNGQHTGTVAIAFRHGKGKVAVIGSWKLLTIAREDNQRFVLNILQWLAP